MEAEESRRNEEEQKRTQQLVAIGTDYLLKRAQAKDAETQTGSERTVEVSRGTREERERRRKDRTVRSEVVVPSGVPLRVPVQEIRTYTDWERRERK